jgi:hypothetical protein
MNEKYFYCRADSTLANDDDNANGSCVIPVKHLLSMGSTSDTALALRFRPRMNQFSDSADSASNKTDSITFTVAANEQKTVIERILAAMAEPQIAGSPNMINLFDAVAGTGIKGITAASVAIVAAQA